MDKGAIFSLFLSTCILVHLLIAWDRTSFYIQVFLQKRDSSVLNLKVTWWNSNGPVCCDHNSTSYTFGVINYHLPRCTEDVEHIIHGPLNHLWGRCCYPHIANEESKGNFPAIDVRARTPHHSRFPHTSAPSTSPTVESLITCLSCVDSLPLKSAWSFSLRTMSVNALVVNSLDFEILGQRPVLLFSSTFSIQQFSKENIALLSNFEWIQTCINLLLG